MSIKLIQMGVIFRYYIWRQEKRVLISFQNWLQIPYAFLKVCIVYKEDVYNQTCYMPIMLLT